jgi:hypothetical protein
MILQNSLSNEPRNFDLENVDRRHVCQMQPRRCKTYGFDGYLKSAKKWHVSSFDHVISSMGCRSGGVSPFKHVRERSIWHQLPRETARSRYTLLEF